MKKQKMSAPIDFVITWVDGSDSKWIELRRQYQGALTKEDKKKNTEARYRDMELLKYWFRGVETFAPWVNRIHFVTCGQVPDWLNTEHPKIHLVNHTDFLREEDLPTFNSNAIELRIHEIPGLSENFVYFNDDVFITSPVESTLFFRNGLPCDMYEVKALVSFAAEDAIDYIRLNNLGILNKFFFGRKSKFTAFFKKYTVQYPLKVLLRNIYSIGWQGYIGIADHHVSMAYRKSDFEAVWKAAPDFLANTCAYKFRTPHDVSHWIIRYWRLVKGEFYPINLYKHSLCFLLKNSDSEASEAVRQQKFKIVCLNDNSLIQDFEKIKKDLQDAFDAILPQKSSFEK